LSFPQLGQPKSGSEAPKQAEIRGRAAGSEFTRDIEHQALGRHGAETELQRSEHRIGVGHALPVQAAGADETQIQSDVY